MNTLYYGDCLTIMREKMQPGSVDLVYLDPPFNSKRDYNSIYKDHTGRPLPDQVEAYTDTWFLDHERMRVIKALPTLLREHGVDGHSADFLAGFISGLVNVQADMAAYLSYMTERLVWIKWTMKPTASIYLHCDPTASHYLKIVMDVVFGRKHLINEIVWQRTGSKGLTSRRLPTNHDIILAYQKTQRALWNTDAVFLPYDLNNLDKKTLKQYSKIDENGRRYCLDNLANPNKNRPNLTYEFLGVTRVWRWTKERMQNAYHEGRVVQTKPGNVPLQIRYLDEQRGKPLSDIWTDINPISANSYERLDYATQKPLALLERIIKTSSPPDGVVFDPFCGCATTIEAAEKLGRRWIGCDITIHAIRRVARRRLGERLHLQEGVDYVIDGVPKNWEGAFELWKQDAYQFQKWCVELVEGFVNVKKTADDGIDGRIYFDMPGEKVFQSMALEVKGGENLSINHVRALNSVLQYEHIRMAGLITMKAPGSQQAKNFQQTMALAGNVRIGERDYPKIQMLTVDEILNGKTFEMPSPAGRTGTGYERDLFNPPQKL